jgi:hypothetical protein
MRELQRCSRNNPASQIRRLPPIVRIIILLPLALLLFAYARTVDVVQWRTALSLAIQSITASKPVTIAEVKAAGPTFSRSWYIESTAATAMGDMQAVAEGDVQWTMKSQQCDGKHSASFVVIQASFRRFTAPHLTLPARESLIPSRPFGQGNSCSTISANRRQPRCSCEPLRR